MSDAVAFFRSEVAVQGGYVYRYSDDLSKQEGEGATDGTTVWVQPPGTPAVGAAYLDAYRLTGEHYMLEAALETAECLRRGQLISGGWTDRIEFSPEGRSRFAYRVDGPLRAKARNWSTFDDDKTQSAVRFLIRLDEALEFRNEVVHETAHSALQAVLAAQYPNGAWPQGFRDPTERNPQDYPTTRASLPTTWPKVYPGGDYWEFYTFNDNAMVDTIDLLLLASAIYNEPDYRAAALRGGDFILLAQLPEPHPAWAQQYDYQMHPVWARKFEPPAISGGESQGIMRLLIRLYLASGERKYLEPLPAAIVYFRRSTLPDGTLARFYEMQTNRPLFFTRDYALTYDPSDVPTHYSFRQSSQIESIAAEYARVSRLTESQRASEVRRQTESPAQPRRLPPAEIYRIVTALDHRGAWVEDGRLRYHGPEDPTRRTIETATFIRNLTALSQYLAAEAR